MQGCHPDAFDFQLCKQQAERTWAERIGAVWLWMLKKDLCLISFKCWRSTNYRNPLKRIFGLCTVAVKKVSIVEQRKFQEVLTGLIKLEVKQEVVISPGRSCWSEDGIEVAFSVLVFGMPCVIIKLWYTCLYILILPVWAWEWS